MKTDVTKLELYKARIKNFLRGDFLRAKKLTDISEFVFIIAKRYGNSNLIFLTKKRKQYNSDISFLKRFKLLLNIDIVESVDRDITDSVILCDLEQEYANDVLNQLYKNNNIIVVIDREILNFSRDVKPVFQGWAVDDRKIFIFDKRVQDACNGGGRKELKIQAIISCYNEEDIIGHTIEYLIKQGVYVHIIDNWSTDDSKTIISKYVDVSRFVTSEKFPVNGPSNTYDWGIILNRVQDIAMQNSTKFDWFVHHDADEVREAPFGNIKNLKDGIEIVDACGFNVIDHVVLNFVPIPNDYDSSQNIIKYLKYCSFGNQYGDLKQVKAWKSCDRIDLVVSSGHKVNFDKREQRIFPYKFLLRHYSLRSQQQAEKKIFKDRKPRWNKEEQKKQWHTHYNHINKKLDLKWDKKDYLYFERGNFYDKYLMQMITSVGIETEDVKVNKVI